MYQKWPDQIFPIVNFVFSHYGHFGLGRGGGGFGGGVPPPLVFNYSKEALWGVGGGSYHSAQNGGNTDEHNKTRRAPLPPPSSRRSSFTGCLVRREGGRLRCAAHARAPGRSQYEGLDGQAAVSTLDSNISGGRGGGGEAAQKFVYQKMARPDFPDCIWFRGGGGSRGGLPPLLWPRLLPATSIACCPVVAACSLRSADVFWPAPSLSGSGCGRSDSTGSGVHPGQRSRMIWARIAGPNSVHPRSGLCVVLGLEALLGVCLGGSLHTPRPPCNLPPSVRPVPPHGGGGGSHEMTVPPPPGGGGLHHKSVP